MWVGYLAVQILSGNLCKTLALSVNKVVTDKISFSLSPELLIIIKPLANKDGSVAKWLAGLRHRRAWVQITVTTLSGNSLRQTVHTHCASVHRAAKLVAALLRVVGVTAGLAESNGSLLSGL